MAFRSTRVLKSLYNNSCERCSLEHGTTQFFIGIATITNITLFAITWDSIKHNRTRLEMDIKHNRTMLEMDIQRIERNINTMRK